jgi:hypothetical protein
MSMSTKQAALAVIEELPQDATMDGIIDALWEWSKGEPAGAKACSSAANRILAANPAELVMANGAARHAEILGIGRQTALEIVQNLPDQTTLDDILVAFATWHWPEDD